MIYNCILHLHNYLETPSNHSKNETIKARLDQGAFASHVTNNNKQTISYNHRRFDCILIQKLPTCLEQLFWKRLIAELGETRLKIHSKG